MTGNDFTPPRPWAIPFATIAAALAGRPDLTAATVDYRDPSSPFRILATLGGWHIPAGAEQPDPLLSLSIARGTLHDEDRGTLDLAGFEIGVGASDAEPYVVLNPGRLSELQQAGLADAVESHLRVLGICYVVATLEILNGTGTVIGVLGTSLQGGQALAAFAAPRSACEAAGAIAGLSAMVGPAVTRLTTIPSGNSHAFHVHAVSVHDAVCLVGRLD